MLRDPRDGAVRLIDGAVDVGLPTGVGVRDRHPPEGLPSEDARLVALAPVGLAEISYNHAP